MNILLFNPSAGTLMKKRITPGDLLERLGCAGVPTVVCQEFGNVDLEEVSDSGGVVIVAGGDGTIHWALKAVNRCGAMKMGIIPGGTANHLAGALGIPIDIGAAIEVIGRGYSEPVDLGIANNVIFSQAAGVGLHAKAFHVYGEREEKHKIKGAAAALQVFSQARPQVMRVIADDQQFVDEMIQVTVANTPVYGTVFNIAPEAKVNDGLLDVVMLGSLSKLEVVEYGIAAMNGQVASLPKATVLRAKKIEIDTMNQQRVEAHADAQPIGFTPVMIEVMESCVEVIVPERLAVGGSDQ